MMRYGLSGVAPGDIETSGLTLAANSLAGNSTGARGPIEDISVGSGLSLSGGVLTATGGASSALTFTTSGGTFTSRPIVNMIPAQSVQYQSSISAYSGKWASVITLFSNTGLISYSFDDLEGLTSSLVGQLTGITTFAFPALKYSSGLGMSGSATITSLSYPVLEHFSQVALNNFSSLTSISFPNLISISNGTTAVTATSNSAALASFSFGSAVKAISGVVNMTSCALNQASVDNILVTLASLDGTNGTAVYENRAVTITGTSATPSATGLAAKATLVARGCTVTNN